MKAFVSATLLLLCYFLAEADKNSSEFGDIRREELTMVNYSTDTSAAAVILFDKGSTALINSQSGHLTYKRHVRIKIFRKEAFDKWASVSLYVERGTFGKLAGITYNLEKDSIIKSEIDDDAIFISR